MPRRLSRASASRPVKWREQKTLKTGWAAGVRSALGPRAHDKAPGKRARPAHVGIIALRPTPLRNINTTFQILNTTAQTNSIP